MWDFEGGTLVDKLGSWQGCQVGSFEANFHELFSQEIHSLNDNSHFGVPLLLSLSQSSNYP